MHSQGLVEGISKPTIQQKVPSSIRDLQINENNVSLLLMAFPPAFKALYISSRSMP